MAFEIDNLNSGGAPAGQTSSLTIYETQDTLGTVEGSDYFDEVSERFDTGDVLIVVADTDGTPKVGIYRVSVSSGSVTLNSMTAEAKLTDNSGGSANDTVAAVSGSGDDATINDNLATLSAKVNAILDALGS